MSSSPPSSSSRFSIDCCSAAAVVSLVLSTSGLGAALPCCCCSSSCCCCCCCLCFPSTSVSTAASGTISTTLGCVLVGTPPSAPPAAASTLTVPPLPSHPLEASLFMFSFLFFISFSCCFLLLIALASRPHAVLCFFHDLSWHFLEQYHSCWQREHRLVAGLPQRAHLGSSMRASITPPPYVSARARISSALSLWFAEKGPASCDLAIWDHSSSVLSFFVEADM
mmetsp:Transcript_16607/g.29788  ORF Transcript_16607/g.29788 Transcript_16607/m.29788 type:complete len:224 (-) Transcript_16607:1028-1699(-)